MPVLHLPALRESADNTPPETPNSKSLRHLQKLRAAARITEESYRHFWHENQGEASLNHYSRAIKILRSSEGRFSVALTL